jgi:N utilization substance protein A
MRKSVDEIALDLRDLHGLSPELIGKLADNGVHTLDDLADLAVDELSELTGQYCRRGHIPDHEGSRPLVRR